MAVPLTQEPRVVSAARRHRLVRLLAAVWAAAIVYGSLLPWHGWRVIGVYPLAFLVEPWPRFWTAFDVVANVLAYVPLGALLVGEQRCAQRPRWATVTLAVLICSALSLSMESLQTLLPGRVPSRLDWLANTLGSLLGALAARMIGRRQTPWLRGSTSGQRNTRLLHPQAAAMGALVVAWLIAQMAPQRMLFETGVALEPLIGMLRDDLARSTDGSVSAEAIALSTRLELGLSTLQVAEEQAPIVETLQIVASVAAVGLLVIDAVAPRRLRAFAVAGVLVVGVLLHIGSAYWIYEVPKAGHGGLSAGAQGGLVLGVILLALTGQTRRPARLVCAMLLLSAALLLTNVWPGTAYRDAAASGQPSALRNVHALLQAIALLWPFAAFAVVLKTLRLRRPHFP
jgi:VanZ family protein